MLTQSEAKKIIDAIWGNGRGADAASQVYRSEMGSAADRKHEFITMLADDKTRDTMRSRGREAVRQAALVN